MGSCLHMDRQEVVNLDASLGCKLVGKDTNECIQHFGCDPIGQPGVLTGSARDFLFGRS